MEIQPQLFGGAVVALLFLVFNATLTKEILTWEPSPVKRTLLLLVVWLVPVVGAFFAYKYLDLSWFKKPTKKSSGEQNVVSGALLEIDAIFNPGQRHVIEARQKEQMELSEDGQQHNSDREEIETILKKQADESSKNT
ncbi:hypothetical protein [Aliikangiella sp. G2MR2-5]|uniref:hypothetical protein n=1 Tax=Aliikangiella sp. G2MR2-5 TaxID=2788943 RepID=UPI0018AB7692|nr:hypothetical protein [Aliikangiella sp. G2MR2-5]